MPRAPNWLLSPASVKCSTLLLENALLETLCPEKPLRGQESFRELYRQGELDDRRVTVDLPGSRVNVTTLDGPGGQAIQEMISRLDRCFLSPKPGVNLPSFIFYFCACPGPALSDPCMCSAVLDMGYATYSMQQRGSDNGSCLLIQLFLGRMRAG